VSSLSKLKKAGGEDGGGGAIDLSASAFAFVGGLVGGLVGAFWEGRCQHCVRFLLVLGRTWDRENLDPCLLVWER
jgi:hypothetical protein